MEDGPKNPLELRFRLGPIPVSVEPGFWFITALFGITAGFDWRAVIWVGVVFVSVLVHELGHALAARLLGSGASIRLYSFGGLTYPEKPLSRAGGVAMSLAGPFAGFAIGALVVLISLVHPPASELGKSALRDLIWVNFGWGVFNLLPVLPLDGGHVLLGVLGPKRQRITLLIGGVFGALVALGVGLVPLLWAALLFGLLAFRNFQAWWQLGRAPEPGARTVTADAALQEGWDALRRGDEALAYRVGEMVLNQAPEPDDRNRARDLLAWTALARSEYRDALRQLERSEPPEAARALTWAMVLEALESFDQAVPYALRAVEVEPSDTAASLAARLMACAGQIPGALTLTDRFAWSRPAAKESAFGEIAFAQGGFPDAARRFGAAFELGGAPGDAFNAACSHARAGAREQAFQWIERALKAGFDDLDQLRADPDLASLQGDPELDRLLAAVPRA